MTVAIVRTHWLRVATLWLAGIAVSFLVGKAPAALALLKSELGLSLFQTGLVVATYSLVSGLFGLLLGMQADRIGHRRIVFSGMALAAAASFAGAFVTTPGQLLLTRALEGLGFFVTVISLPPLLLRASIAADRQKVMGLWSAYMPTGMGTMLLLGGILLETLGWRGLWQLNALLIAGVGLLAALAAAPLTREPDPVERLPAMRAVAQVCRPGPLLLSATFGGYAAVFLIVTAFLPLILVEQAGWSLAAAGSAGAAVIIANIIGCFGSGPLLDRGITRSSAIVAAALVMALSAVVMMSDAMPIVLRLAAAAILSAVGGLIPGVLFAGVPVHAPTPRHIASVNGLMLQGVAFGQLFGPALAAWIVDVTGSWFGSLLLLLPLCAMSAAAGLALGKLEEAAHTP